MSQKSPFWSERSDTVAEGSGLCSPVPVPCRKHISVENNLLHHTHETEVAGGLLVHRLLKMLNLWPWTENWGEGPQQALAQMVATREAEAKPHLRQGTSRVRAQALVVTAADAGAITHETYFRRIVPLSPPRSSWAAHGTSREAAGARGQGGGHRAEPSSCCPGTGSWENSPWDISADVVTQHMVHRCFSQHSQKGEITE